MKAQPPEAARSDVAYDSLDPQAKQRFFAERRQPRAKDKPVIRGLAE